MKISRINCFSAICKECKHHLLVKKNFFGDKNYVCLFNKKPHKKIDGKNCGNFRCIKDADSILCEFCRRGEDVKTFIKKL